MALIDLLKKYRFTYKNYIMVMYNVRKQMSSGKETKIKVKLRNGQIKYMDLSEILDYTGRNYYMEHLKVMSESDNVTKIKYGGKLLDFYGASKNGDIMEVFFNNDYRFLQPDNGIVIDIGANIGDSSIYFALNNAKMIIAIEPQPYSYNFAVQNINANDLNDKIILINAGYGIDSEIKVDTIISGIGSKLITSEKGKNIPIYSLKTIINTYNLNDDILLKMDCEGCEYSLLSEDNNTLRKFKRIQIEYHYGYTKLVAKLEECGFNVKWTKPTKRAGSESNHSMCMGFIYAEKL